jgi:isopentenyl-diphosphate Delta-isomerase
MQHMGEQQTIDQLITVDIYNKQTGTASKEEIHRTGLLHRAFSVFIYSGTKMLLQKRAFDKYHSGGLWANTCCSHPRDGEDTMTAAKRRLKEEVGLEAHIREEFTFLYFYKFAEGLYEYEYDHVYIGQYPLSDGETEQLDVGHLNPDPSEIEELEWVEFEDLEKQLMTQPEKFAPWFIISAPKVLKSVRDF